MFANSLSWLRKGTGVHTQTEITDN
jgi:hypothetical protein